METEFSLSQAVASGDAFEHRPSERGHCVQDFSAELDLRDLPGEAAEFEFGADDALPTAHLRFYSAALVVPCCRLPGRRVFKTEFILDYLSQPALRTRIRRGLLKGEQLHVLARCVHYGRLGRLDQRDFERQTGAASCLLLILAAIIYWQIREIDRVLSEGGSDADDLNFQLLSHISPIGWDNVLLYGEYQLNRSLVRSERLSV